MPDITITNVEFSSSIQPKTLQVGEAIAEFDVLYLLSGKYYKADATDVDKAKAVYMALQAGALDSFVPMVPLSGLATLTGPTLVVGDQYVLSANAGKIAPRDNLVATNYLTHLFIGNTTSQALYNTTITGIQL